MSGWTLQKLAEVLPECEARGNAPLCRLQIDSRLVEAGDLFAALPGQVHDGLDFLSQAISSGAVAVLVPRGVALPDDLPALICADAVGSAGRAAHRLAGDPTDGWPLLAVTGTNGKTTSATLLAHLLSHEDARWGLLGSVDYQVGARSISSSHTTPDAARLAAYLSEMRAGGLAGAVMEASSHSLDQHRLEGCRLAGALFTNLSRDHLDYHGDMEDYFKAKRRLLDYLLPEAPALANADDPWMARLAGENPGRVQRFGRSEDNDFQLADWDCRAEGSRLQLIRRGAGMEFRSPLLGEFNVVNVAGALALALAIGESYERLAARLQSFDGVPGRMQRLPVDGGPVIILDFAHTPDAIAKVTAAARPLCRGKLRVLFGAGGDRDRGKRPLMAAAAQTLADRVYLTSDNPRNEDPEAILDEVEAGLDPAGAPWIRICDRREAIFKAVTEADAQDMVLLLGKGHETTQEIAGLRHPFSDGEMALEALRGEGSR